MNLTMTTIMKENKLIGRTIDRTYKVYQVFELPRLSLIADNNGKLVIPAKKFVELCLKKAQFRNQQNVERRQQRSSDYFTSLNHAERYRIPLTMRRFNSDFQQEHYGLLAFVVARGESVKNKVYNQRVSSINADLLELERISEIVYPTNYQRLHPLDLSELGRVISVHEEGFNLVRLKGS